MSANRSRKTVPAEIAQLRSLPIMSLHMRWMKIQHSGQETVNSGLNLHARLCFRVNPRPQMLQVQICGFFRFFSLTATAASEATCSLKYALGSGASVLQGMGCEDDPSENSSWLGYLKSGRYCRAGDSGLGWKIWSRSDVTRRKSSTNGSLTPVKYSDDEVDEERSEWSGNCSEEPGMPENSPGKKVSSYEEWNPDKLFVPKGDCGSNSAEEFEW